MLSLIAALVLSQDPDWVESARLGVQAELVKREVHAFCSDEQRRRMYAFELLCLDKPVSVTTANWHTPKRDDTWTVRIDTVRFAKPEQVTALLTRFRELTKSNAATTRADGGMSPTLAWCETSYVFAADTVVVASVQCGALRPWRAATETLMKAAGPDSLTVIGLAGGSAYVATEPAAAWRRPATK